MNDKEIHTKPYTKESLFSIGEHFYTLDSLIIDNEGEIDETLDQWLNEYEAMEAEKVDAYCYIIQKFEEIATEAKRLSERSRVYSNKAKTLKDRLKYYLESRGRDKLETSRFTIRVSQNGGQLPIILNEGISVESLPEQFIKRFEEPDLSLLREAILGGDNEAMRFARILPRGTHLRIK